jgi:Prokaryotic Cytochrome C oxidase subunit IV
MDARFEKRLLVVWLALCVITVVSLIMGSLDRRAALEPNAAITSAAIVIALVKVRIIFREFMEVRHAPVLLCRLTDAWVLLTAIGLLGTYFAGTALQAG